MGLEAWEKMKDPDALRKLCMIHGQGLTKKAPWLDGVAVLAALAEVESKFGSNAVPRHEKSFHPGGEWNVQALHDEFGCWACCAYSSWQIQFSVARELGFPGRPEDLQKDDTAVLWVLEYIEHRILRPGCKTLEQLADAYNSGSFKDAFVPTKYVADFVTAYPVVVARRNLQPGEQNAGTNLT